MSDAFLDKGEIVSTRGRNAEEIQRLFNARPGDLTKRQADHRVDQRRFRLRRPKSSPAPCRTKSAPRSWARARSASGSVQTIIPLGSRQRLLAGVVTGR